ncbi:NAD(P)/FAD-dependent oxidoreductase [Nonomuraea endophytica]|uniref:NADPH-dependent 2,4-dienoyl-CoA reductase/sulfur reductase-like enzyme n=1 Tax=Nonomuraea endophytica TaxID=714136 RepID=A0A7W8EM24_9ACTN|nr:FAD-dependent oxidoreductase [Nonomuraea endophytica]MBB5084534.1 NADPH-dependent 2,4-dienoyl-CoA reductase/sulfur reductase-like enzyme [Nonomuraea endophytica]
MRTLNKIIVVGASLAGLRAVQTLRQEGFDGEITLVGAETHLPYNRPPLSKGLLRGDDDILLPGAGELDDSWSRGRTAVHLNPATRTLTLDDGAELGYDGLVIATGARPRPMAAARMLRTLEDALALRAELERGHEHVVVVGAGFIGGEVASTARELGLKVTLIDSGRRPMLAGLGEVASAWLAGLHERGGVELVSGVRVQAVEEGRVRLADGRAIPAGLVVAGLGVVPNTEWLDGSGLPVDDGVLVEETLFARGSARIVAAGDVARWPHSLYGGATVRVEHWSNANDQGAAAARNLLAGPEESRAFDGVPNFATSVHGSRIQTAGLPHLADTATVVAGAPEEDRFAVAFTREDVLVGAVAVNSPKDLIKLKRRITAGQPIYDDQ